MDFKSIFKLQISDLLWALPYFRPANALEKKIRDALLTQGYYVQENFLNQETVKSLVDLGMQIIQSHPDLIYEEGGDQRIFGIERLNHFFCLPQEMQLPNRIEKKFQFGWRREWFQLFGSISATPGNLGSGAGWHRDSPFQHQFKAIIYLTDVPDETFGPFECVPGSHRKESLKQFTKYLKTSPSNYRFTDEQISRAEDGNAIPHRISIVGKRGTLILADTRMLHRGRPLQQGSRMALTRYYFPRRIPEELRKFPLLKEKTHASTPEAFPYGKILQSKRGNA